MPPTRPPQIRTIIPTEGDYFAAFLPDEENGIEMRVVKILCWSVMQYPKPDEPDEVVGQIIDGSTITEVTNVDEEEGFGTFFGYFESQEAAVAALMTEVAEEEGEDDEEESGEEDEGEEEEEDEEEEEEDDGGGQDQDDDDDDIFSDDDDDDDDLDEDLDDDEEEDEEEEDD